MSPSSVAVFRTALSSLYTFAVLVALVPGVEQAFAPSPDMCLFDIGDRSIAEKGTR